MCSSRTSWCPYRYRVWVVLLVMILVAVPTVGRAQTASSGAIAGVVRDASGAVLPGVTVEASSPALIEKVRTAITDGQGQYRIIELRPGTYAVTFTLPGFSAGEAGRHRVDDWVYGHGERGPKVGGVEETITVSGASPVVDTHNVRTQNTLTRDTLDTLPTNREVLGLVALTVGVTSNGQDVGGNQGASSSSVSIHGSDQFDARILMDGMVYGTVVLGGGGPSCGISSRTSWHIRRRRLRRAELGGSRDWRRPDQFRPERRREQILSVLSRRVHESQLADHKPVARGDRARPYRGATRG